MGKKREIVKGPQAIRDRIIELRRVPARDLIRNAKNWRRHPENQQGALRGLLNEIGYSDALLARETEQGLLLIDGHLRADTTPDAVVPVLVLDLDEAEADKLLATLDPLAALAETDDSALDALLATVETEDAAVAAMLAELGKKEEAGSTTELKSLETRAPPAMSWILVGIDTVRFGEVTALVERLAAVPGIICETTVASAPK